MNFNIFYENIPSTKKLFLCLEKSRKEDRINYYRSNIPDCQWAQVLMHKLFLQDKCCTRMKWMLYMSNFRWEKQNPMLGTLESCEKTRLPLSHGWDELAILPDAGIASKTPGGGRDRSFGALIKGGWLVAVRVHRYLDARVGEGCALVLRHVQARASQAATGSLARSTARLQSMCVC